MRKSSKLAGRKMSGLYPFRKSGIFIPISTVRHKFNVWNRIRRTIRLLVKYIKKRKQLINIIPLSLKTSVNSDWRGFITNKVWNKRRTINIFVKENSLYTCLTNIGGNAKILYRPIRCFIFYEDRFHVYLFKLHSKLHVKPFNNFPP